MRLAFILRFPAFINKISIVGLIFFLTFFNDLTAWAAPVFQKDVVFTQADGSTFVATPFGDERNNGYETKDGFTILFDKLKGNWVYADRAVDGLLKRSDISVNKGIPKMQRHLRPLKASLLEKPEEVQSQSYDLTEGPVLPTTGNQSLIVILVQFTDRLLMTSENQWADLIFNDSTFSKVRHYFKEASYNNIDLVPASENYGTSNNGVIVVTLPYNHPNTGGDIWDTNRQITRDALIASDPYVDFGSFDIDGNGYLSSDELKIVIIVAGYETAYGGTSASCSPGVWAHTWSLFWSEPPTLDGKVVASWAGNGSYVQQGEWHCSTWDRPGHMATIGVTAHELGHTLLLPDEYDTDGSSNGIGKWGLMGNGIWNACSGGYPGNCPSHPTAWDKWYVNWLTPIQITETQVVDIPDVTTDTTVYQLRDNPNGVDWSYDVTSGTGEYFLLENRQRTGYNAGLPGSGLLIWHIWEGALSSNVANQNEAGKRLIDLREADGLNDLDLKINNGDAGDPFPGTSNNTAFDDISNPSSRLYCFSSTGFCDSSGVSVTDISDSGPVMTAILTPGTLLTLLVPNGSEVIPSGSTYTVLWGAPSEAVKFDLMYSLNNGKTWKSIASNLTSMGYNWKVPKPINNKKKCLVKVVGYNSFNIRTGEDVSDSTFTIEVVRLISPDGGENLTPGGTHAIKWLTNATKRPVAKVKLFYSIDAGATWKSIKTLSKNKGSYNWIVPSVSSNSCKIKVVLKDANGKTVGSDISNGYFAIQP